MKSKKVLLGLLVGVFALFSGNAIAQTSKDSKIVEIGPDNIGGRVTSLIVDQRDATHNTVFAGTSNGGLYVRSENTEYATFSEIWNKVHCVVDNKEVTLPISCMVQLPDNNIVIGTGEGCFQKGSKFSALASLGRGVFIFNPDTRAFTSLAATVPDSLNSEWANINKMAFVQDGNVLYFFVAAKGGLYRWTITSDSDWQSKPERINIGDNSEEILDVAVVKGHNIVYFASRSQLYRLSSIDGDKALNVSTMRSTDNEAIFQNAGSIRLATSEDEPDYLYAMICDKNGIFKGLFLTSNGNSFIKLTTSTVDPFLYNDPKTCGAILIDMHNTRRIYIGGSSLIAGQGYVEGGIYQWTNSSYNEIEFGSSNFMNDVFASNMYVHSGINQIVQVAQTDIETGEVSDVFYIATNGGVFVGNHEFSSFTNINRGLNNVQINGLAVATDGSLLAGATYNANLFIESRCAHSMADVAQGSGIRQPSWYDSIGSGLNHYANVIWYGNGGQVAISRFQQYAPETRRVLFLGANDGAFARAYNDYMDYNNTQTWTIGSSFLGGSTNAGFDVAQMRLWESDKMSGMSNVSHSIDTNDMIIRNGVAMRIGKEGSNLENSCNGILKVGDSIWITNTATASYPFMHRITKKDTITHSGQTITVDNPIQSHLYLLCRDSVMSNGIPSVNERIAMCWNPSDFTKVYTYEDYETGKNTIMNWGVVYSMPKNANSHITTLAVSPNGDHLLAVVSNTKDDSCFLVHVQGMVSKVDYTQSLYDIENQLSFRDPSVRSSFCKLVGDSIYYNGSFFPRHISDIFFVSDDKVVVTFEGHENDNANVMVITGITTGSYTYADKSINGKMAAYSVLVEHKGDVLVGTENGLYRTTAASFATKSPVWTADSRFNGIPVTSLIQQTNDMDIKHVTLNDGINVNNYVFPRTKYLYAIYIGTYGAGIYMDSSYVEDHNNEVVDPTDYLGITPVLASNGQNSISIYPNPAVNIANISMNVAKSGNAQLMVYDMSGRLVVDQRLGMISEGTSVYQLNCSALKHGMYLVNLRMGGETSASKLIVR